LQTFRLKFSSDIVAITGDGAAVMVKFGRISPAEYIQCENHGLHIGVLSVVFPKKSQAAEYQDEIDESESESEDLGDSDSESDGNEPEDEFEDEDETLDPAHVLVGDYLVMMKKMRKIVLMFKASPVKNSILQEFVKKEHAKELQLDLDVKTRWNSLESSGQKFLRLESCVVKALEHRKISQSEMWSDRDSILLKVNIFFIIFFIKSSSTFF
jgi:hypothetical protein